MIYPIRAPLSLAASALFASFFLAACGGSSDGGDASFTADGGDASFTADGGDASSTADGGDASAVGDGGAPDAPDAPDAAGVDGSMTGGPTLAVDLGTAGDFAILAKTGISTVPASAITGDIGVSPAAATFITGFSLTADSTGEFSTSSQVTGRVYASDYTPPTPADMTAAIGDMELAFADAAGRAPGVTELGAGSIGGMTLEAGVYAWGTGLLIPTDVTLDGSATDVWIFQIAGDLTMSSGARVTLAGSASPRNVFWQVGGLVDLGTTAHCEGTLLSMTSVTLRTGASLDGRILAQSAVDIDGSTVVAP